MAVLFIVPRPLEKSHFTRKNCDHPDIYLTQCIICSKPNFFMTSDFITLQVAPESRTILMAFSYMVTIACNEGLRLTRLFWFELPVATCQTESVLGLAPPFWSVGFSLYSSVDLLCGHLVEFHGQGQQPDGVAGEGLVAELRRPVHVLRSPEIESSRN